jgi:competence protein ComK
MINEYEINSSTIAVISLKKGFSKIIEDDDEFLVSQDSMDIIDESCKFFGSSYNGRFEGTKSLIGINYKAPIIIEESQEIIFFPTGSPRFDNCSWICLKKIGSVEKKERHSIINFKNGCRVELQNSYNSIENQILRSTLLESRVRNRKKDNLK